MGWMGGGKKLKNPKMRTPFIIGLLVLIYAKRCSMGYLVLRAASSRQPISLMPSKSISAGVLE
jgi:hypothetical protein